MRTVLSSIILVFIFTSASHAGRPKLLDRILQHRRQIAPTYQQRVRYANWRYPKYTGAFHYNYFRDMGVPPGDVGFRGNGVYPTPW